MDGFARCGSSACSSSAVAISMRLWNYNNNNNAFIMFHVVISRCLRVRVSARAWVSGSRA